MTRHDAARRAPLSAPDEHLRRPRQHHVPAPSLRGARHRLRADGAERWATRSTPAAYDLIFAGGAQDREQRGVVDDLLATKADGDARGGRSGRRRCSPSAAPTSSSARFYRESTGAELPGAGIFDLAHANTPAPQAKRCIGNIVAEWDGRDGARRRSSASRTTAAARASARRRGRSRACAAATATTARTAPRARSTATPSAPTSTARCCRRTPRSPTTSSRTALARRHDGITLAPIDDRAEHRAHAAALRLR